jgi:hypothetical protein
VAFRDMTDEAHRAETSSVGREHRKGVQQRIDPAIKRRRGHESSVQGFVPRHAQDYPSGFPSDSSRTRRFCILWKMLRKRRERTRHTHGKFSANPHQYGPSQLMKNPRQGTIAGRACCEPLRPPASPSRMDTGRTFNDRRFTAGLRS